LPQAKLKQAYYYLNFKAVAALVTNDEETGSPIAKLGVE
jgi:hypothetical protein